MSNTLIVCKVFNTLCLHTPEYSQRLQSVSDTECECKIVIVCTVLNTLSVLDSCKPTDTSVAYCTNLHCENFGL